MSRKLSVVTTLRPNQIKAVEAIASGQSYEEAAEIAGVTLRTMQRWNNDPAFIDAKQVMTNEIFMQAGRALVSDINEGRAVMKEIMNSKSVRAEIRLRAAIETVKIGATFAEKVSIAARLEALEHILEDDQ